METINDLRNSVQAIFVKNYGDFKRKAITYVNRFEESTSLNENQKKQIYLLKWYVQYYPNHKITETKQWTLEQIDKIESHADSCSF